MGKKSRKNNLDKQDIDFDCFENADPKAREKRRSRRKSKHKFDQRIRNIQYEDEYEDLEEFQYDDD